MKKHRRPAEKWLKVAPIAIGSREIARKLGEKRTFAPRPFKHRTGRSQGWLRLHKVGHRIGALYNSFYRYLEGSWISPMTFPLASLTEAISLPPPTSLISCTLSAPTSRSFWRLLLMSLTW